MKLLLTFCLLAVSISYSEGLYSKGGAVTVLDPSNFKSSLKKGTWMVEFYAPWCGHCKNLKPEWEKAAKALNGIVNVAAVDCDAHKEIAGEYGVGGFPTIFFMYSDGGKIKKVDYSGERTAKGIVTFAMDKSRSLALKRIGEKASSSGSKSSGKASSSGSKAGFYSPDSNVVNLDDDSWDQVMSDKTGWFVEFFAPWCGHCKNLKPEYIDAAGCAFSPFCNVVGTGIGSTMGNAMQRAGIAPSACALHEIKLREERFGLLNAPVLPVDTTSTQLKDKVKFRAVNCDEEKSLCGKFNIGGFPTIKFFGSNKRSPMDYQGGRDAASMAQFGLEQWAKNAPPPEVVELKDASAWAEQCVGSSSGDTSPKQLCFIAFLPDILDSKAAGRKAYISTLKKAAEHNKGKPYGYLWVQGGAQSDLEANMDVGGFGYPALVAYSPKHKSYTLMKGALETAALKDFIGSLRTAGGSIRGELAEIKTIEAWDGKDGVIEEEEEFDLNDIMGEEL